MISFRAEIQFTVIACTGCTATSAAATTTAGKFPVSRRITQ